MWKNKVVRYHHDKCYYCICTVCDSVICPYMHKQFKGCYSCKDGERIRPRLDCDYFKHFKKSHQYRIHKVTHELVTLYNVRISGLGVFNDVTLDKLQKLSRGREIDYIEVSRCVQDLNNSKSIVKKKR